MVLVEIYSKKGCCLCNEAKKVLKRVVKEIPFSLKDIDIMTEENLFRRYKDEVPIIFINGKKAFKFKVDEQEFRRRVRKELIKDGLARLHSKKRRDTTNGSI